MLKFLKYFALLLFSGLWFLGCSIRSVQSLEKKGWIVDEFRFGDLYRLSNLPSFKVAKVSCSQVEKPTEPDLGVFIAGDSFSEDHFMSAGDFGAAQYLRQVFTDPQVPLDFKTQRRILIIETVERHAAEKFEKPYSLWKKQMPKPRVGWVDKALLYRFPYSEDLHQSVLFGHEAMLWIKEKKAQFNQFFFNRIDEKVLLSPDKKQIYYYLDHAGDQRDSHMPLAEASIAQMVQNLNETYAYYRSMGFDEVILSIIPNKSTAFEAADPRYNHLIEKIENNKDLKMPVVSVFNEFTSHPELFFQKSDSHWTCAGRAVWLKKVNQTIDKVLNRPK